MRNRTIWSADGFIWSTQSVNFRFPLEEEGCRRYSVSTHSHNKNRRHALISMSTAALSLKMTTIQSGAEDKYGRHRCSMAKRIHNLGHALDSN